MNQIRLYVLALSLPFVLLAGAFAQYPYHRAPTRDADNRFRKQVCSWQELKFRNLVKQKQDYSCGAAALATVLRYYWEEPVTEAAILDRIEQMLNAEEIQDRVENGLTLTDLKNVSGKAGYLSKIGTLKLHELSESKVPLVVGIVVDGHEHFAVYRGTVCGWVFLADPIRGNVRLPECDFKRQWQKNAILVVAPKGAKPRDASALSVRPSEVVLGATNWQQVREFPSDVATSHIGQNRPY